MSNEKLQLFNLIDNTVCLLEKNMPLYKQAAFELRNKLSIIFCEFNDELIDLHTRIKSAISLKEKIIRNKLYKNCDTPEKILDNLSDLVGIMVECRFNRNEVQFYNLLKKHFYLKNNKGYYYSQDISNIFIDLDTYQPQTQKNGHSIYRIDGYYIILEKRINFELQIKSLVNTFWSEIEHKIVYKNNVYIPNQGYIMDMLTAIRGNLHGIDKMLQIVSDQIQEVTSQKDSSYMDVNFAISKLISDTFILKMSESIGFTVDFKRICDLISGYILNKYKDLPVKMAQTVFLDLVLRVNEIYERDIDWEQKLDLEGEYIGEDKFSQIFGDRLIEYMNTDFNWHIFFLMLFQIESDSNNLESFTDFMNTIRSNYSDKNLYKRLYKNYDKKTAEKIYDKITEFLAYTLSATASLNIIDMKNNKIKEIIDDTINFICSNYNSYDDFIINKKKVQMFILEKWEE